VRGEDFFLPASGQGMSSARLAFSYEMPERIAEGIERLAGLLAARGASV
jgi:DNA-binding transcriptional MocR family regulator